MDEIDEFDKLLDKAIKSRVPIQTQWVRLQNIKEKENICDAKDVASDLEFYDVWLGFGSEDKTPKDNTIALIGLIENNPAKAFLIMCEDLEQWKVKAGKSVLNFDKDGFLLKKENETLKKLMVDLLQEIQNMKFTTNTGSTILLVNKPQFMNIENRFKQFLK